MATPGLVNSFNVQQGNRQVYLSWGISAGATSYSIQRSTDGVNFTVLATPAALTYIDSTVAVGSMYYYQIAATNGSGTGIYTQAQKIVSAPAAEMSLLQLRTMSRQRADKINSQQVTDVELNTFINLAMYELYDLLITADEEYFVADPIIFPAVANQSLYPLPDGLLTFTNGNTNATNFVAPPFYKFKGQDLSVNAVSNAFATIDKFNFIDRNNYLYPNSASGAYGVWNLRYRLQGSNIKFIPTPSANQNLQMWYIPRLTELVADTDITTLGISGWLSYVIARVAKYILDKEESDSSKLDQELIFLKQRIEETSANRDTGQPDTISNLQQNPYRGGGWGGGREPSGGY